MDIVCFLRGLLIGFSIAAPVGPIGVLCIRRTLADGRLNGLVSGLGAATADAFYGSVAGFGLTFISGLLIGQRLWLHLIGGVFLCYLGVRTFLARPAEKPAAARASITTSQASDAWRVNSRLEAAPQSPPARAKTNTQFLNWRSSTSGLAGAYTSTLFLTLTNPTTIFSFAAIFAGLGVASAGGNYLLAGLLVLGVFLGSACWWLFLSSGVSLFRAKFGPRQLRWVNRISGIIILTFGVLALLSAGGG